MTKIPDYTEKDRAIVQITGAKRWKNEVVEIQLADIEVQINPKNPELTECPALFCW